MIYPLIKMHGAGNDFLILDNMHKDFPQKSLTYLQEKARQVCHRHFGIGADGLVILEPGRNTHARWTFLNSDGSIAEMCGNAARCAIRYLHDKHFPQEEKILL